MAISGMGGPGAPGLPSKASSLTLHRITKKPAIKDMQTLPALKEAHKQIQTTKIETKIVGKLDSLVTEIKQKDYNTMSIKQALLCEYGLIKGLSIVSGKLTKQQPLHVFEKNKQIIWSHVTKQSHLLTRININKENPPLSINDKIALYEALKKNIKILSPTHLEWPEDKGKELRRLMKDLVISLEGLLEQVTEDPNANDDQIKELRDLTIEAVELKNNVLTERHTKLSQGKSALDAFKTGDHTAAKHAIKLQDPGHVTLTRTQPLPAEAKVDFKPFTQDYLPKVQLAVDMVFSDKYNKVKVIVVQENEKDKIAKYNPQGSAPWLFFANAATSEGLIISVEHWSATNPCDIKLTDAQIAWYDAQIPDFSLNTDSSDKNFYNNIDTHEASYIGSLKEDWEKKRAQEELTHAKNNGVTAAHKHAIFVYSHNGSTAINNLMKGNVLPQEPKEVGGKPYEPLLPIGKDSNDRDLRSDVIKESIAHTMMLCDVHKRLKPWGKNQAVYRGESDRFAGVAQEIINQFEGAKDENKRLVVGIHCFWSSAHSLPEDKFYTPTSSAGFLLTSTDGRHIAMWSAYPLEREILLAPRPTIIVAYFKIADNKYLFLGKEDLTAAA